MKVRYYTINNDEVHHCLYPPPPPMITVNLVKSPVAKVFKKIISCDGNAKLTNYSCVERQKDVSQVEGCVRIVHEY